MFSKLDIDRVNTAADIRDFVPGADRSKPSSYVTCPKCGASGKGSGLCVTHKSGKNMAHCFKCEFSLTSPIAAQLYYQYNDDKNCYPKAVTDVAREAGVVLHDDTQTPEPAPIKPVPRKKKAVKSFCEQQLEASGLTVDDVMVRVPTIKNGEASETLEPAFRKGGLDAFGNIRPADDEMLIYYYRLDGTQEMYATRGARGALRPYIRIRWSNPAMHTKQGSDRENKYMSPKGAPTRFYIPQRIRDLYNSDSEIETLIIQEGEKKAEKACKHGIPSIGIQGIFNIGNREEGLPSELQYIIQRCHTRRVVLLFDSDWDHLSQKMEDDDRADKRPRMFFYAARKFVQYIASLHNANIDADIYIGHINENDHGDKGIDDLLMGELRGREELLRQDIDFALHAHNGVGTYCTLIKATTMTEPQLADLWLLNNSEAFFERHAKQLRQYKSFKFGAYRHTLRYKVNDDGTIILASKSAVDKDFWTVETNETNGNVKVSLVTYDALDFITGAGYYRIHTDDLEKGKYDYIHIEDGVVYPSSAMEIREFVWAYILQSTTDQNVRNHFSARLTSDLGDDKLERLERLPDNFDDFRPGLQCMYFRNGMLRITPQGVEWRNAIEGQVWADKVINHRFKRVPIIEAIDVNDDGSFNVVPTAAGRQCEFYRFLEMTSNFWWQKDGQRTPEQEAEFNQHLLNKLTAIGYLLNDYKYQTELKAVIAMDGEMSDVGQSNGRTGKSLIGAAISKVIEQTTIDGRNTKNDDDFIYSNVTLRTRNIFLDDVNVNFNFERFYFAITGDLAVNPKARARFTIPAAKSPKFYITTNHAINGCQSRSSQERIIYMAFSNYFNETRHPIDVFGHQFFADWESGEMEQWNLFYNLMAECNYLYQLSMESGWARPGQGVVLPPMHDIQQRTQRQEMGESLYQWAEVYFDVHINEKLRRIDMFQDFKDKFPEARNGISPANFKKKLIAYCQFKGYHLNPSKLSKANGQSFKNWVQDHPGESFIGDMDKAGGVEYLAVYNTDEALKEPI